MPDPRTYPHLGEIEDPAIKQTIRLLWDRVHDLQQSNASLITRVAALEAA